MLNHFIIAGEVKECPVLKETSTGLHYANMLVEVRREYRNNNGEYDSDLFNVLLWRSVADHCTSICEKGDIVSIKGRMQSSRYDREDGGTFFNYDLIAEKVFFSSK